MSSKKDCWKFVAFTGPTNAGKTQLLEELRRRRPDAEVLSFDEYDLFPSGSEAMDRERVERTITNWEDPALFDIEQFVHDLGKLAQGQSVQLATRSRESMARDEQERVLDTSTLNIVEGIFVLHDPRARALFDLSIFIDIPPEVMIVRRMARERGSDPWDKESYIRGAMVTGTEQYVLPQRQHADLILDGLFPTATLADTVEEHINAL